MKINRDFFSIRTIFIFSILLGLLFLTSCGGAGLKMLVNQNIKFMKMLDIYQYNFPIITSDSNIANSLVNSNNTEISIYYPKKDTIKKYTLLDYPVQPVVVSESKNKIDVIGFYLKDKGLNFIKYSFDTNQVNATNPKILNKMNMDYFFGTYGNWGETKQKYAYSVYSPDKSKVFIFGNDDNNGDKYFAGLLIDLTNDAIDTMSSIFTTMDRAAILSNILLDNDGKLYYALARGDENKKSVTLFKYFKGKTDEIKIDISRKENYFDDYMFIRFTKPDNIVLNTYFLSKAGFMKSGKSKNKAILTIGYDLSIQKTKFNDILELDDELITKNFTGINEMKDYHIINSYYDNKSNFYVIIENFDNNILNKQTDPNKFGKPETSRTKLTTKLFAPNSTYQDYIDIKTGNIYLLKYDLDGHFISSNLLIEKEIHKRIDGPDPFVNVYDYPINSAFISKTFFDRENVHVICYDQRKINGLYLTTFNLQQNKITFDEAVLKVPNSAFSLPAFSGKLMDDKIWMVTSDGMFSAQKMFAFNLKK